MTFKDTNPDADAFNDSRDPAPLPEYQYEDINHTLYGTLTAIRHTILLLHTLGYAEPNDWSRPLPTGRSNELMALLTKRVRVD